MMINKVNIRDEFSSVRCGQCQWFSVNADREPSLCKRLDHKTITFAKPYFKSYDCGQYSGCICRDFEPAEWCYRLRQIWTGIDDYNQGETLPAYVGLVLNDDWSIRYSVRRDDFINNTFRNEDGSLKWVKKMYYRQSRSSPTGYKLITELSDEEVSNDR